MEETAETAATAAVVAAARRSASSSKSEPHSTSSKTIPFRSAPVEMEEVRRLQQRPEPQARLSQHSVFSIQGFTARQEIEHKTTRPCGCGADMANHARLI